MLTPSEREVVVELLVREIQLSGSPRRAVVAVLNDELAARLADGSPLQLAETALTLCINDGYRCAPPSIVRLLKLIEIKDATIPGLMARLRVPPLPQPDAFDALILDTKQPFLARSDTRVNLRALLQERPVQPVVIVNGQRRSGKSHTALFIEHVLRTMPQVQHCMVELGEHQGTAVGPQELGSDIYTQLGGDPREMPEPLTNRDRWLQELASCIIAQGTRSGLQWWIVLDGFNAREIREDTKLFIVKLAASITKGMQQRVFRLILLDFERAFLTLVPGKIAVENTTAIPRSAVAACVAKISEAAPGLDQTQLLDRVMLGLAEPIEDLTELGARLGDLLRVVEQRV